MLRGAADLGYDSRPSTNENGIHPMANRISVSIGCAVFAAALVACQPEVAGADGRESAGASSQNEPLHVTEITVGAADAAETRRGVASGDAVEVRVGLSGHADNAELRVKVIALANGTVVGEEVFRPDASTGPELTARFTPESPFASGRYLIEVTLDGKLAGHRELEIQAQDPRSGNAAEGA